MKRKAKFILFAGFAAIPAFLFGRNLRKKKNLEKAISEEVFPSKCAPNGQPLYDFKNEENLIFCNETMLGKRLIQLENSINIRDIGGYTGLNGKKVKWRKVIRSEELAHLSDKDVNYFVSLDLKHSFDFRDSAKAKKLPDKLPETTEYNPVPVFDGVKLSIQDMDFTKPGAVDAFMREIYSVQTKERAQCFADVLKYMTDPEAFPILYHCTNGKDRTGFMTYLLLSLLGVSEETIMSDYTLTNLTFDESFHLLGTIMSDELSIDNYYLWDFYGVKPAWLQISIDYIKQNFGTVDKYLLSETDLTQEDIQKIRDNLLE